MFHVSFAPRFFFFVYLISTQEEKPEKKEDSLKWTHVQEEVLY